MRRPILLALIVSLAVALLGTGAGASDEGHDRGGLTPAQRAVLHDIASDVRTLL